MPDYRLEGAGSVRAAAGMACAGARPVEASRKTAGEFPGDATWSGGGALVLEGFAIGARSGT